MPTEQRNPVSSGINPDNVVDATEFNTPYQPISLTFAQMDEVESSGVRVPCVPEMTKETFGHWLTERIEAGMSGRYSSGYDIRVQRWRDQYEGVTRPKNMPWKNSANLFVPQSRSICDSIHADLKKALFGVSPMFQGENFDPTLADTAQAKECALDYICRNVVRLPQIADEAILRTLIDGTAIAMPYWKHEVKKTRAWEQVTPDLIADLLSSERAKGTKSNIKDIKSLPAGSWTTVIREEITFDGAQVKLHDVLNFGMYPTAAPTLSDAQVSWVRHWDTASDLWQGVKSGYYDEDAVAELLETAPQGMGRWNNYSGGDAYRLQRAGINPQTEISDQDKPYEICTTLARVDTDSDGLCEIALIEVERWTGKILRAELYPYFHDRPFFVPLVAYIRPGMFYGYSLMEILEMPQAELNTIRNQRVDNGTLRNASTIIVRRGIKWNPERDPIRPGLVIPTDNPREDIIPLQLGAVDQSAFAEEAGVRTIMQEVSGVTATRLGQAQPDGTTLGEVEQQTQATNLKFDVLSDRMGDGTIEPSGFAEVGQQISELYGQYGPDTFSYMNGTTGQNVPTFADITREAMRSRMDFRVRGTSALANPVLQQQKAEKLVMFGNQSPFVQSDPAHLYEISKAFLVANGHDNYEAFIGTLPEFQQKTAMQMQIPQQPEVKVSESRRIDEITSLALLLTPPHQPLTPEGLIAAAQLARQVQDIILPQPKGVPVEAAPDNGPGYPANPMPTTPVSPGPGSQVPQSPNQQVPLKLMNGAMPPGVQ